MTTARRWLASLESSRSSREGVSMIPLHILRLQFRTIAALALAVVFAGCGSGARSSDASAALRRAGGGGSYHPPFSAGPTIIPRADGSVPDERRYEPFGAAIDSSAGRVDY